MGLGKRTRKYLKHRVKKSRFTRNKNNIKQGGNRRVKRTLNKRIKRTLNKTRKIGGNANNNSIYYKKKVACLIPAAIHKRKVPRKLIYSSVMSFKLNKKNDFLTELTREFIVDKQSKQDFGEHQGVKIDVDVEPATDYKEVLDVRIKKYYNPAINNYYVIKICLFFTRQIKTSKRALFGIKQNNNIVPKNDIDFMEFYGTKEIYDLLINNNKNKQDEIMTYEVILNILERYITGKEHVRQHAGSERAIKKFIYANDVINNLKEEINNLKEKINKLKENEQEENQEEEQEENEEEEQEENEEEEQEENGQEGQEEQEENEPEEERKKTEEPLRNNSEQAAAAAAAVAAAAPEPASVPVGGSKKRKRTRKRARRRR